MATKYIVSVVVNSYPDDPEELPVEIEIAGPAAGIFESESIVEAGRVARFLGGIGLRIPPIDLDALMDEEISATLL